MIKYILRLRTSNPNVVTNSDSYSYRYTHGYRRTYRRLLIIAFCSVLTLNACQKPDNNVAQISSDNDAISNTKDGRDTHNVITPVEATTTSSKAAPNQLTTNNIISNDNGTTQPSEKPPAKTETTKRVAETNQSASASGTPSSDTPQNTSKEKEVAISDIEALVQLKVPAPPAPDPDIAIIGTQISRVDYKNAQEDRLEVIYETSVTGELNAIVTLPSGQEAKLTAQAGQGNNPIYSNRDDSIEIVSHDGGGSIDLIYNGKVTDFRALKAETAVIQE